jgi:predicted anti-sigma-YlaC factor YlaD
MACESWQEAISAVLDGEPPTTAPELVEAHLRRCPSCRTFAEQAEQLRGRARVRPASAAEDLAPAVSRAIAVADRASVPAVARLGLLVVAVQIVVLAVPELLGSFANHGSRHLGSFSIAYAIALVVVAVRPARAPTVLPVALVLVAALGVTAVADAARGSVAWLGEVSHAPELLSLLLLWSLTRRRPRDGGGVRQPLRLVEEGEAGGRDRRSA